ncbi:hypothetical protein AQUCO_11000020v1 [Aquilegia coerulea]|uniref:Uncharacterized protein n=1 Tax=Aquilegia coerulea TaxID=218851 RepID=A0A2G5C2X4_AQUCA|nr:hypothetical protein AQUCO_11000020v1 [Aquilegia coerulea]
MVSPGSIKCVIVILSLEHLGVSLRIRSCEIFSFMRYAGPFVLIIFIFITDKHGYPILSISVSFLLQGKFLILFFSFAGFSCCK